MRRASGPGPPLGRRVGPADGTFPVGPDDEQVATVQVEIRQSVERTIVDGASPDGHAALDRLLELGPVGDADGGAPALATAGEDDAQQQEPSLRWRVVGRSV